MTQATHLRYLISLTLCLHISIVSHGQDSRSTNSKNEPQFATAGEQEIYWAKQIFKNNYKKKHHKKFSGSITKVNAFTFKVDTVTFTLPEHESTFGLIIENRLLNPTALGSQLLDCEEPEYLRVSPTVKRFKIMIGKRFAGGVQMINPIVYFLELTNKKATADTDMKTFIEGSELTFLKQGWVML